MDKHDNVFSWNRVWRFCIAFCLLATPLLGQNVTWNDIALDYSGKPIAGATITVCSAGAQGTPCSPLATLAGNNQGTTANPFKSDAYGNYNFTIAPGDYVVQVSATGLLTQTLKITVPWDPTVPLPLASGGTGTTTPGINFGNPVALLNPVTGLEDKGGQVFNVKAYGAVGNGTTDDEPAFITAFNTAVAAGGGIIYVPPTTSCYLFNETLNLTGGASGSSAQVIFQGGTGNFSGGSKICGNTGTSPIIDTTAMSGVSFRNLVFDATVTGLSNPSQKGYISGRSSSGVSGQQNKIIDCTFKLPLHTSNPASIGIYLYGVELQSYARDVIQADFPLIVTGTNIYSLNSTLDPWGSGTYPSIANSFVDMELDSSGDGFAAYLEASSDITLTGHSWNFGQSSTYSSFFAQTALSFSGGVNDVHIQFRQDGYPGFLGITGNLTNSYIQGTTAPGPTPPYHAVEFESNSSNIVDVTFRIVDSYSTASSNYYYDASFEVPNGVGVLDNVSFSCGAETNCGYVPVATYSAHVSYSGNASNPTPVFNIINTTSSTYKGTITRFYSKAQLLYGQGAPTGACVTPSLYLRNDGTSGSTLYVCENSAWSADGGTVTPSLTAGAGISISGTWPSQTITNADDAYFTSGVLSVAHGGTGTATGSITGTGPLSFSAGGTNTGINLIPNGTGAVSIPNNTAATSTVSQSSPPLQLTGQYWNGTASAADTWTLQNSIANGTNGLSTLSFTHNGSSNSVVSIPTLNLTNPLGVAYGGMGNAVGVLPYATLTYGGAASYQTWNYGAANSGTTLPSFVSGFSQGVMGTASSWNIGTDGANNAGFVLTTTTGTPPQIYYFPTTGGTNRSLTAVYPLMTIDGDSTNSANTRAHITIWGSLASSNITLNATQTTISGTTAGSAVCSEPFTGSSYKKALCYLSGYENTTATAQTYTFPTAFANTPYLAHDDSGGSSVSTTTLTFPASMAAAKTGWVVVEGY